MLCTAPKLRREQRTRALRPRPVSLHERTPTDASVTVGVPPPVPPLVPPPVLPPVPPPVPPPAPPSVSFPPAGTGQPSGVEAGWDGQLSRASGTPSPSPSASGGGGGGAHEKIRTSSMNHPTSPAVASVPMRKRKRRDWP